MKEAKRELDALGMFKADLVSFTRYYEFMSQICDYGNTDLEKLSLYARHLAPLLREEALDDDVIDLTSVALSHYRLSKIKQQDLMLVKEGGEGLQPGTEMGTGKPKSKKEEWLSEIIARLNELFVTDGLTDQDMINYAITIRDKVSENNRVMDQIENNSPEQALLGDFAGALDEAVMNSSEAHQNQMMQYLNSKELQAKFQRLIFDMLLANKNVSNGGTSIVITEVFAPRDLRVAFLLCLVLVAGFACSNDTEIRDSNQNSVVGGTEQSAEQTNTKIATEEKAKQKWALHDDVNGLVTEREFREMLKTLNREFAIRLGCKTNDCRYSNKNIEATGGEVERESGEVIWIDPGMLTLQGALIIQSNNQWYDVQSEWWISDSAQELMQVKLIEVSR